MLKNYFFTSYLFIICIFTNAQVGIGTNEPMATLDIVGDVRIRNLPAIATDSVYILGTTQEGYIKKSTGMYNTRSSNKLIYQSDSITLIGFDINNKDIPIIWHDRDKILDNNITFYNTQDSSFSFKKTGLYNFSCFVNYRPTALVQNTITTTNIKPLEYSALAVLVLQKKDSTAVWKDIAGSKQIWDITSTEEPKIIRLDNVYSNVQKNEKIRFVLRRPSYIDRNSGTVYFKGLKHGFSADTTTNGFAGIPIISAEDMRISKELTITLIQQ